MRTRFVIFTVIFLLPMLFAGCEGLLNGDTAPKIYDYTLFTTCGGEDTATERVFLGSTSGVLVDFETGNVNQDFEASVVFDSQLIPQDKQPVIDSDITFTTISTVPGSAKGKKRLLFHITAGCSSTGLYNLAVVITDLHGQSDVLTVSIPVEATEMFGSNPCKCVSQCGFCTTIYKKAERCTCGCEFYDEKCE